MGRGQNLGTRASERGARGRLWLQRPARGGGDQTASHSPELPTHGSSPSGAKAGRGGQRAGLAEAHPDVALSIYPCPMWDTCPPHPQPRMVHQPLSTVGGGNQGVGQPSPSCCASQRFSCGGGGGGGGVLGRWEGNSPGRGARWDSAGFPHLLQPLTLGQALGDAYSLALGGDPNFCSFRT